MTTTLYFSDYKDLVAAFKSVINRIDEATTQRVVRSHGCESVITADGSEIRFRVRTMRRDR